MTTADTGSRPDRCPLCGHPVDLVLADHPAFAAPGRFDVWDCAGCDTRFAWPMRSSAALYEQIYRAAPGLPGYERYAQYRAGLADSDDALDWLARREDVYWGVREALRPMMTPGRRLRVLEIGSGMGYLTFALHRAGIEAIGIDHSHEAVEQATRAFGPLYRVSTAESLASMGLGVFDAVVATELIEHLEAPEAFIRDASTLLAPGGRLVLTTPDKEVYPRHFAWHTDLAPVHFWWFSRTSLRRLAWSCGLQPSFVELGAFHGFPAAPPAIVTKPQSLDAQGRVVFRDSWLNTVARAVMRRWPATARPIGRLFLSRMNRAAGRERLGRHGLSLCAILEPSLQGAVGPTGTT